MSETPIYDAVKTELRFDPVWPEAKAKAARVRPAKTKRETAK